MLTSVNLLPNHFPGIYKEMRGALEEQVFNVDFKSYLKGLYEICILEEFDSEVVGVKNYARSQERKNQRNGYYTRSLDTIYGFIDEIRIPRPRIGGFSPKCLDKFARRERAVNKLVQECFFRGVSTRDIDKILKAVCHLNISPSSVSRITDQFLCQVKSFHQRPLSDDYVYLMFDGIWIKNRFMGTKRRLILVAYGITSNGVREIIDYQFARSESEQNWLKFLTNLQYRGLAGEKLKLITTDGCKGLANAIDIVYPASSHQLCWAHKMRNILKSVKVKDKKQVHEDLKPLFAGNWNLKKAMRLINKWRAKWRIKYPRAVRCLEKDIDKLLNYLNCPLKHHKAIRTSNHIERQFKEYRRRMKAMEITPTIESADKILYSLTMIRNDKLKEYPLDFTQNTLH